MLDPCDPEGVDRRGGDRSGIGASAIDDLDLERRSFAIQGRPDLEAAARCGRVPKKGAELRPEGVDRALVAVDEIGEAGQAKAGRAEGLAGAGLKRQVERAD